MPTEAGLERVFTVMMTDRLRALWLTMLAFGPRRGEALAMRWSLLDLDAGTVKLRTQIRRHDGQLVEKSLKTKASRATLSSPAALDDMLREQIKARQTAKVWADPDLVFTTSVGTPIEPRNVNRSWSALRDRAGVPGVGVHDLRHAAATMASAAGASVKEVQAMLRHTCENTTSDLYVHVFESVRKATAYRMDGVLRRIVGESSARLLRALLHSDLEAIERSTFPQIRSCRDGGI